MAELPAIINRVPPGLLNLLGLKQTGRNPSSMAEFVQPIMELRDWYFAASQQVTTGSAVPANSAFQAVTIPITVPQDETWYVLQLSALLTRDAAAVATLTAWLQYNWGGGPAVRASSVAESSRVGARITMEGPRGLFLPPGTTFSMLIDASAAIGAAAAVNCTLLYVPLKV